MYRTRDPPHTTLSANNKSLFLHLLVHWQVSFSGTVPKLDAFNSERKWLPLQMMHSTLIWFVSALVSVSANPEPESFGLWSEKQKTSLFVAHDTSKILAESNRNSYVQLESRYCYWNNNENTAECREPQQTSPVLNLVNLTTEFNLVTQLKEFCLKSMAEQGKHGVPYEVIRMMLSFQFDIIYSHC